MDNHLKTYRNLNPEWYKLTKLLKQQRKINTGLTIPYIFGAYKILKKPFTDIPELINEIQQIAIDKYPVIQMCDVIHQHVIAVEDKRIYHKPFIKDIKLENAKNEIGLIISENTNLGKTGEMIFRNLTQLYKKYIDAETFSWHYKEQKWKSFSKDEIDTILSIQK